MKAEPVLPDHETAGKYVMSVLPEGQERHPTSGRLTKKLRVRRCSCTLKIDGTVFKCQLDLHERGTHHSYDGVVELPHGRLTAFHITWEDRGFSEVRKP